MSYVGEKSIRQSNDKYGRDVRKCEPWSSSVSEFSDQRFAKKTGLPRCNAKLCNVFRH